MTAQTLPSTPGSMILLHATQNETFDVPVVAILSGIVDNWTVILPRGMTSGVLTKNIAIWENAQVVPIA